MEKLSLEKYFVKKGLTFRVQDGQANIKGCKVCGDQKWNHFYISLSTGAWDCKKCGAKGSINQFLFMNGDEDPIFQEKIEYTIPKMEQKVYKKPNNSLAREYAQNLWSCKPEELDYLKNKRGFTDETLKYFQIGVDQFNRLTIPIFDKTGELINMRYRKNPKDLSDGPKYTFESGCQIDFFNADVLERDILEIFITEGEFDAMTLWQNNFKNVISVPLGANNFKNEWKERFGKVKRINLCFDNDETGIEGAKKVAKILGEDKCYIINLPKTDSEKKVDVNEFFSEKKKTAEDFLKIVEESKPVAEKLWKHISEFNDELRERILRGNYLGETSGFGELDKLMGGFRKGRLVVLAGSTSVGKTTFSQNIALQMAVAQKTIGYISMEMPPIDLCRKFLMLHKEIAGDQITDALNPEHPLMKTIEQALLEFKGDGGNIPGLPIYLFKDSGEIKIETIKKACHVCRDLHGAKLIVIDHLHYFGHTGQNKAAEISKITREIKALAMALDIPILLLAHVSRAGRSLQRKGMYIPQLSDLKESSSIEQDADQVLFVCRDSESSDYNERKKVVVKLSKNRDGAVGHVNFNFDLEVGTFSEELALNYLSDSTQNNFSSGKGKKVKDVMEMPSIDF